MYLRPCNVRVTRRPSWFMSRAVKAQKTLGLQVVLLCVHAAHPPWLVRRARAAHPRVSGWAPPRTGGWRAGDPTGFAPSVRCRCRRARRVPCRAGPPRRERHAARRSRHRACRTVARRCGCPANAIGPAQQVRWSPAERNNSAWKSGYAEHRIPVRPYLRAGAELAGGVGRLLAVVVRVHQVDDPVQVVSVHPRKELINHVCHRALPAAPDAVPARRLDFLGRESGADITRNSAGDGSPHSAGGV